MDDIKEDYLKTNEYTRCKADEREKYLREVSHVTDENLIEAVRDVAGVRLNWLESAFEEIEQLGGFDTYIRDYLKIDDTMLEELRDNYLE